MNAIYLLKVNKPIDGEKNYTKENSFFIRNEDNTENVYPFYGICNEEIDQTNFFLTYYKDDLSALMNGSNFVTFGYGVSGSGKVRYFRFKILNYFYYISINFLDEKFKKLLFLQHFLAL